MGIVYETVVEKVLDMDTFLAIAAAHITTTALGVFYVYRHGASLANVTVVAVWALLFFPVVYNLVKYL